MAPERFVVLGLAPARSSWFRSVGLWANSGALPAEFVRCISAEEVRARLASGRAFSALVADAGLPAVDRDLVAAARAAGCAVLVVDDGRATRDWLELGAARVLPPSFGRDELVAALTSCAHTVRRGEADASDLLARPSPPAWRGAVAALTGPGGTGVSTAAIALAQSLADDVRHGGMVLLADLRLRAEQAVLHDAGDVLPCVQELVEAHRSGQPTADEVRSLAFTVPERRYSLLLGLRRARHWPAIRPQAFEAAFDSLRRAWGVVVCDIDADLEGEDDAGSIDVEERNVMARTAAAQADVVFAVGLPELKGVHSLVRVLEDLIAFGTDPARIVPVINRAPRSARARAGLAAVLAELTGPFAGGRLMNPVHVPERNNLEADLHDGARVASALGAPLAGAFRAVLDRPRMEPVADTPEPVRPGRSANGPGRRSADGDLAPAGDRAAGAAAGQGGLLDMAGEGGRAKLRSLIADEVVAWSDAYKRGLRAFDLADPDVVAERAYRNLAGYGPLEPLLADDDVWEIMVNAPDQIFVKRHRGTSGYHDEAFNDDDHVIRTLTKILDEAAGSHRKLDPSEGLQDAQLDTGARLHIVHGDVGRDGHVLVNVRKFTGVAYRHLDELVDRDMLDTRVAAFLRACVRARLSIVFSGSPGSGKTTLLSCCAAELDPSLRVVVAEEVFEADLPLPNVASMQTRPARPDGGRSTFAGWSPASCAWPPTSPWSARCATARGYPETFTDGGGR